MAILTKLQQFRQNNDHKNGFQENAKFPQNKAVFFPYVSVQT
jgi:hypothetical protein